MRTSNRRAVAALVPGCALLLLLAAPSPAVAAPSTCQSLLPASTPSVIADVDGDGNPDATVPAVTDVTLCVGADVVLTETPGVSGEQCAEWATCWRFYVDYHLTGYAAAGMQVCYTAGGVQNCTRMAPLRVPLDRFEGGTVCIGVDLAGGRPCDGEVVTLT